MMMVRRGKREDQVKDLPSFVYLGVHIGPFLDEKCCDRHRLHEVKRCQVSRVIIPNVSTACLPCPPLANVRVLLNEPLHLREVTRKARREYGLFGEEVQLFLFFFLFRLSFIIISHRNI
mgnify:CR=1 FL=1